MDFEETLHHLRQNKLGKKVLKVILTGCLVLTIAFIILIVVAILLAATYHTQIYEGFMRILNFIFGDSPGNVLRGFLNQFANNWLQSLFSKN